MVAERNKPKPTGRFDPENFTHKKDPDFLAVTDVCIPQEPQTWAHPENENIVFAYGLPQMIARPDLDVSKASREEVLEWIYVRLWRRLVLGNACKNVAAAAVLLRIFMVLPSQTIVLLIQRTVLAAGRRKIGSPTSTGLDGIFGSKTRGAIYAELCDHYDQTKLALFAQVYSQLQENAGTDEDTWGPVFQAYATQRI